MARKDLMKLGLSIRGTGYHAAAWRHAQVPAGGDLSFAHYLKVAEIAERGAFDMIFFADAVAIREDLSRREAIARTASLARLEPITLLSAIAARTSHIGLTATASTSYNEPYHIARKFASLDHISGGRACWNAVTSWSDAEAWNFGRDEHYDYAFRYGRAREFVEVVLGLWDSWEEGTAGRDKKSGIYFDPQKLHRLNHKGAHFSVRGPLNVERTPQGRPVVCQAGQSEEGQALAAATADIVFSAAQTLDAARVYYESVKGRLAAHGRSRDSLKVLPGILPIVGRDRDEAKRKYDALQALIDPEVGRSLVETLVGDLGDHPLDAPLPDLPATRTIRSLAGILNTIAQDGRLTLRQLYEAVAAGRGHRTVIGDARDVADALEEWFVAEAADGFNVAGAYLPGSIEDFTALVVPELRRRGLFRSAYEGRTLRENLGLAVPENRYAAARRAAGS